MSEPLRQPPTATELDRLVAAQRENPRSPAFLPLAEAYLALGRPREAIEALTHGLVANPDNLEARVLLGRAHCSLHEWKEAQVELLRVVKSDRANREGFRLLGEVLMRRQDFERAVPILVRAADLDPANGKLLTMLRRAREGRPLDAPAPVPTPVSPSGSPAPQMRGVPIAKNDFEDGEPTRLAEENYGEGFDDQVPTDAVERPEALIDAALGRPAGRPSAPPPTPPRPPARSSEPPAPPRTAPTPVPAIDKGPGRATEAVAPVAAGSGDPPRPPVVRPSEIPKGTKAAPGKAQNLGAPEMRRSAAVGEDYLNNLLVGGLLTVPNVEAREHVHDPGGEMGKKWRRKTRNAFIVLFVLLIAGGGGGGAYVYLTHQKRDASVAKKLDEARVLVATGRPADYKAAQDLLLSAYELDRASTPAIAALAQVVALDFLVYGEGSLAEVDGYVSAAGGRLRKAADDAPGKREYVIAVAARNLAVLDKATEPAQVVSETRAALDGALAVTPGDGTLLFLDGWLKLVTGDRDAARAAFEKSDMDAKGPPGARVAIGDLLLDAGDAEGAQTAYETALKRSPQHPFALVGRALARVERSEDAEAAMQDVNVGLSGPVGRRGEAWKQVALAYIWAYLEDYEKSGQALDAASKAALAEPRFQARVALLRLDRGNIVEAGQLRQKVRYVGDAPSKDPLLLLLDAELFMASGLPEDAVAAVGQNPTLRGHLVKGRALLDLDKPKEAQAEFEAALNISKDDARAKAYVELARVLVARRAGASTSAAYEALQKQARGSVSGFTRYVLAEADLALGKSEDARRNLEGSLEGDNPLAYRARVRLAELYLAGNRVDEAEKALREALVASPVYVPAHAVLGRILLSRGKVDEALGELEAPVTTGRASAADELAYATALVALGKKAEAKEPLLRAKAKGAPAEQVGALAAKIDPAFAAELGVKGEPEGPAPKKTPPKKRRRGR